jgi:hypothetical protein
MSEADRVANFERIEGLVKSGRIDSLPIRDVRNEHKSLLRNSPTSHNPQFEQRWKRVELALSSRIASDLRWWQKPLGVIVIAVLSAVLSAAVTAWLGLK